MALIKCPKCGKQFSDRAEKCPQCGISKEEVARLIAEKEAAEAAERERISKEQKAKEAEEARVRAEKRAAWWAANKKKVGIAILILIGIIVSMVAVKKISDVIAAKHAVAEAYEMIEQGEKNVSNHQYIEAREYYKRALKLTNDADVIKLVQEKQQKFIETEKQYPFTSPDLKWAGVKGNVKMIQEHIPRTPLYSAREIEYKFDKKGNLTSITINGEKYQIERMSTGQIEYIHEARDDEPNGTSYTLNSEGFVIQKYDQEWEIVTETSYVLNKKGLPVSAESRQRDNAIDNVLQKYSFTYSRTDKYGNWEQQNTQLTLMYETPQVVNYTTYKTITYWDE